MIQNLGLKSLEYFNIGVLGSTTQLDVRDLNFKILLLRKSLFSRKL